MNIDIHYDFGCKLVRGKPGKYSHSFGGDFRYNGTIPQGCPVPVHLLFRLDMSDPVLPFRMDSQFRFLPFFFAFSYDASPLSYRVRSDTEIEILGLDENQYTPDVPCPGFPQYFDSVPISVEPIRYEEHRDIAMYWSVYLHHAVYEAIPPDEIQRLRSLGYPVTRIGRVHDFLQLPRGRPCPNPECENYGVSFCLETIATIPERPFPDLDIWQADGPTIQIVYEICKLCGSIRTYNTYD